MIYDNPFELGVVIFRQIHISMDCFKKKLMVCTIHRGGFLQMFPKKKHWKNSPCGAATQLNKELNVQPFSISVNEHLLCLVDQSKRGNCPYKFAWK